LKIKDKIKLPLDEKTFLIEIGPRIRELEKEYKNRAEAAESIGVGKSTLQAWSDGQRDPSFRAMASFCQQMGRSLDWLAFGTTQPDHVDSPTGESVFVPVLKNALPVKNGGLHPDHIMDHIILSANFIRQIMNTETPKNCASARVQGDDMAPTLDHGDTVLIDTSIRSFTAHGLYAMQWLDALVIKRINITPTGINCISDNKKYPDMDFPEDFLKNITILGRVQSIVKQQ